MKIKTGELEALTTALVQLDGANVGTPGFRPHVYKNPKLQFAIARNLRKVKGPFSDFEEVRQKAVRELLPTPEATQLEGANLQEFQKRMKPLIETEVEIDLWPIKLSELNLAENVIPSTVLANLGDVLVNDLG